VSIAIVSGAAGLVGSEAVRHFASLGLRVVGIDNNMRAQFFGEEASTIRIRERLLNDVPSYVHHDVDIRDEVAIRGIFEGYGRDIALVIHAAAQPSHDWAATNPTMDFTVNANGTLVILEATRRYSPDAVFIFTSTNKVYGDLPNTLPLVELEKRWEIDPSHPYEKGIPEEMSIDSTLHSLFGASKASADLLVQEYGRYFGMRTACFRGGCLTGPNHSGTQFHGFLAYLMRCTVTGARYRVFGYKAKQVRDNIHSADLIQAFHCFFQRPRCGEIYNMGGSRFSNCSMLEAIDLCQEISGKALDWEYVEQNRKGDHIWYISDVSRFQSHFPEWRLQRNVETILKDIYEGNEEQWTGPVSGQSETRPPRANRPDRAPVDTSQTPLSRDANGLEL
jgi:CDP-paratose 2-epimerase